MIREIDPQTIRKINPQIDFVFKRIMSEPEIILDFLTHVFAAQGVVIKKVTLVDPIKPRTVADEKLSVADVLLEDDQGRFVQVEIQLIIPDCLPSRMLYTWAANHTKGLTRGKTYETLKPTYAIWVLGGKLLDDEHAHHHFELIDAVHKTKLTNQLSIHTLELPKCPPKSKIKTGLEQWIYFFEHGSEFDPNHPPRFLQTPVMDKVFKVLQEISDKDEVYWLYRKRLDAQMKGGGNSKAESLRADRAEKERDAIKKELEATVKEREAEKKEHQADKKEHEATVKARDAEKKAHEATVKAREAAEQEIEALKKALQKTMGS